MYNCPTINSDISNCIQESSCAHSMDVGVKCLPFTDAGAVPVNEVITPTPQTSTIGKCTPANTHSDGNEMSTSNRQPPTSAVSSQPPSDGKSSNTQSTVMSTSVTLGALIGLLAAALVVVVTGWIVSCAYFQWKINK